MHTEARMQPYPTGLRSTEHSAVNGTERQEPASATDIVLVLNGAMAKAEGRLEQ